MVIQLSGEPAEYCFTAENAEGAEKRRTAVRAVRSAISANSAASDLLLFTKKCPRVTERARVRRRAIAAVWLSFP